MLSHNEFNSLLCQLLLQNAGFTQDTGDSMSFDECLQLLAETFPVEQTPVRKESYISPKFQPKAELVGSNTFFQFHRLPRFAWTCLLFQYP